MDNHTLRGGDQGRTEKYMREACDLEQPDIPAHMGSQTSRARVYPGASDSQQDGAHEGKQEVCPS